MSVKKTAKKAKEKRIFISKDLCDLCVEAHGIVKSLRKMIWARIYKETGIDPLKSWDLNTQTCEIKEEKINERSR